MAMGSDRRRHVVPVTWPNSDSAKPGQSQPSVARRRTRDATGGRTVARPRGTHLPIRESGKRRAVELRGALRIEPATEEPKTRHWAMRTDEARRAFIWSELLDGGLRQGWGYREDQDLELLARIRRAGGRLDAGQQATWRGNRLLRPTEPGAVSTGDLVVLPHLPRDGAWSIARVTGGHRYAISDQRNATAHAQPDDGHIREVTLLTGADGIDPAADGVSDQLRAAMRPRLWTWNIDAFGEEIEGLLMSHLPAGRSPG